MRKRTAAAAAIWGILAIGLAMAEEQPVDERYAEAVRCKAVFEATRHPRTKSSELQVQVILDGFVALGSKTAQEIDTDVATERTNFARATGKDRHNMMFVCLKKFPPGRGGNG